MAPLTISDVRNRSILLSKTLLYTTLLLIFTGCCIQTSFQASLPLLMQAPDYNVSFPANIPLVYVTTLLPNTTQPTEIISAFISGYREVQLPYSILYNYSSGDQLTYSVKNTSIVISNYTFSESDLSSFSTVFVNRSNGNSIGSESTITLPNSGVITSSFTFNPVSDMTVPIPRPEFDRTTCRIKNPNTFTPNCTCDLDHTIARYNIKLTLSSDFYPFTPVQNPSTHFSAFITTLKLVGPWNLDYYYLKDIANFATFDICDVAVAPLNFSLGKVIIRLTLFTNSEQDNYTMPVSVMFDKNDIEYYPNGDAAFYFQFMFYAWNHTLYYDPDFSILIEGVTDRGPIGGGGDGNEQTDGGGGKTSTYGVVLAVVLPVLFVTILIVGFAILGGAIVIKKRKSQKTLNKVAERTASSEST